MEQTESKKNIMQAAMEAGAFMGVYFVIRFIVSVLNPASIFLGFLSTLLVLLIPVILYYLMLRYHNQNGRSSNFAQLWALGLLLFFFASLISGLVQYIYYVYINPDYIRMQFEATEAVVQMLEESKAVSPSALVPYKEPLELNGIPTPMSFVMARMWVNIFFGSILSAIMGGVSSWYCRVMQSDK